MKTFILLSSLVASSASACPDFSGTYGESFTVNDGSGQSTQRLDITVIEQTGCEKLTFKNISLNPAPYDTTSTQTILIGTDDYVSDQDASYKASWIDNTLVMEYKLENGLKDGRASIKLDNGNLVESWYMSHGDEVSSYEYQGAITLSPIHF